MDNLRKSLIGIAILTLLYSGYYWGIPALINIEKRMGFIEEKILQKTGFNVSVQKPYVKMGHTPAIWFMAENISLLNDDGSKAVNLDHSAIKVHLLPLLLGKLQIGNFSSDQIDVNLFYTKDSKIKVGQYLLPDMPKSEVKLNKAYFRIGNYNVNLDDLKQNKKIKLKGSYFILDEFKQNKRLKLSTSANLLVNKKSSDIMADIDIKLPINKISENQFKVNGRITNLDLADFSDYAKAFPNSKIQSLSGVINLLADTKTTQNKHKNIFTQLTVDNLGIMQEELARSIYCKNKLTLKSDIDTIKNGLNIKNADISSKGINVSLNGEVSKLENKAPFVDMDVKIKDSRTENFIPLMPGEEKLIEEVNFYVLKKNFFYGDINGELKITGKADTPDVNGEILVTEGYLNKPFYKNAPKATIKLDFKDTKMLLDVNVPTTPKEAVFVTGNVNLYNEKDADLLIKSTPNIDLHTAQIVLNPLHEILNFDIGPVPIMDISGIGNIDLHVIGTRKNPHGWGQFNFRNTTASFLDIHNLFLKNASGSLDFDDQDTHFYTKSATLNNRPVNIDGTCSLTGNLNFNVLANQQDLGNLLNTIKTSPMLVDIQKLLSPITSAKGPANLNLNLTGKVTDINDVVFNKNIFAKGTIELINTAIKAQNIPLTNLSGKINFENLNTDFDLNSNLDSSNVRINGKLNDKNANVKVISNKFVVKDGLKLLNLNIPYKEDIGKIHTSFTANYNGKVDEIDVSGLNIKGKIYASKGQNISIENADFDINNSTLKTSTLKGVYKTSPYKINLNASRILSKNQSVNGNFNIQNFNLSNLNELGIKDIKDISGVINLNGYIKDNGIYADTNLNNINFLYVPENVKINILSGKLQLKKDTLTLSKIASTVGEMPFFTDGKIFNINTKPVLNLYINAKPTQAVADQLFNNKAVYPIKLKGDINCSSYISGPLNAIRNNTKLKLAENASIYYMGATLGGTTNNPVNISVDNTIYPTGVKINNFQYDKLIPSQNKKMYSKPQLNASGNIGFLPNNDLKFNNFKIKTLEPTDAKIFNVIFRKPLMKEGLFTSDIVINGKASEPVVFGKLNITSINMPLFDAIIRDIDLDFKKDKIYLNSKGVVLTNNLNISAVMKNNPKPPLVFDDIKVKLEDLDLNKIAAVLQEYEADSSRNLAASNNISMPDLNQIIIKKSEITADNIKIKNLVAQNFISHITLNDKMLVDVNDFKFDLAEGIVNGNIKYNLLNNYVNLVMKAKDTNAQIIAETLFDLKGQVFGSVTGDVNLYCNGKSQDSCTQTLGGKGEFKVLNGRMPKLGSLEYLLKAGNLVRGGITGLSINGIIDLITPYKTGDFDSINGTFHIANGIADNIKIYSDGKDLNLYMKGSYNFTNLIADMQIFGALTKNFSTLFGKIANASLNTLFNTIPGINIPENSSVMTDDISQIPNVNQNIRVFTVDIYGDINGDDYVKSFKWVK